MIWTVKPEDLFVAIYQLFDFLSTKYLSKIVEGYSLIPSTLSSFLQYSTTTTITTATAKVLLRRTTFDFKNVKLLAEIVQ